MFHIPAHNNVNAPAAQYDASDLKPSEQRSWEDDQARREEEFERRRPTYTPPPCRVLPAFHAWGLENDIRF